MFFTPQRRALFRHLNFQKWSEHGVRCTFWLRNLLRATTACTFSTSELPKVVWEWCALYILTWKSASRHNRVYFFDISPSKSAPTLKCFVHFDLETCFAPQWRAIFNSHLTTWLRTRRFSEPIFRPSGATNQWKRAQWIATFQPFRAPASSFFSLSPLWSSFFFSSPLWRFPLLLFQLTVHIVGSLTSKLPSMITVVHGHFGLHRTTQKDHVGLLYLLFVDIRIFCLRSFSWNLKRAMGQVLLIEYGWI